VIVCRQVNHLGTYP